MENIMSIKNTVKRILLKKAMKVDLGEKGLTKSYQNDFKKEVKCVHCDGDARIGFVAHEHENKGSYLCDLYKNKPREAYWPHDACSVAVYLCKKCLEPTAKFYQA